MSILNRASDGLLSVLLALRNALLECGPLDETTLLNTAAPPSLVDKPEMARKTLTRWKQLGFFVETADNAVGLAPQIASIRIDEEVPLRAAVLRLVLSPNNNTSLDGGESDNDDGSRASDCSRAMAWFLAQDPYSAPIRYKNGAETLQDQQGVSPRLFVNETRWVGFVEWAPFLGAATLGDKRGLVPNPSFALRASLDGVFVGKDEVPQSEFFARLAAALPVVDGGTYRIAVEAQTERPSFARLPTQVSPGLSLALLTLEASGALRLEARSDAPMRMLTGRNGRELNRRVSHVVRTGRI
jgi:hypothetical protein